VVPLVASSPVGAPPPDTRSSGVFGAALSSFGVALAFIGVFGASGIGAQVTGTLGAALIATGLVLSVLEAVQEQALRAGDPFARVRSAEPPAVQRRRALLIGAVVAVAAAAPTWSALTPTNDAASTAGAARLIAGCPERPVATSERVRLTSNAGALDWTSEQRTRRTASLTWPTDLGSTVHEGVVDVWARDGDQADLCRLDVRR
jgi:hypothetical protein